MQPSKTIIHLSKKDTLGSFIKHKQLNLLIKVSIFILLTFSIYYQIFHNSKLDTVINEYKRGFHEYSLFLIALTFILMFLNWGFESKKWQRLVNPIEKISIYNAFKAIFCGIAFAVLTPNRIGEFGGRVFYLGKGHKIQGILVTLIGSFGQILITFSLGIIGLVIYFWKLHFDSYIFFTILFFLLLTLVIILLSYFNVNLVYPVISRIPFLHKASRYLKIFEKFSTHELWYVFIMSLFRYIVFASQFYILLRVYGIEIPIQEAFLLIVLIFLLQTVLPSIAILELGVRGNIALYFLGDYTSNEFGILSASYSLWLINLIIPSLIGGILILRLNFLNNNS